MTPDRLRLLIANIGLSMRALAAKLGYQSHQSITAWLSGRARMTEEQAAWLEEYAKLRGRMAHEQLSLRVQQEVAERRWLEKNPAPAEK